jgi:hypothetical protein
MLYRLITSGYTDSLAYASACVAAAWLYMARQHASEMPGYLAAVPPEYGIAGAAFAGALFLSKCICLEGNAHTIDSLAEEKATLEGVIRKRDLAATELHGKSTALEAEIAVLLNRIAVMEDNSPTAQLSELRKKQRTADEDRKAALSVLVKNIQSRLSMITKVNDPQLLFAAEVLRKEVELVENEIKRGELSYYELCLKIVDINENISELKEIELVSTVDQSVHQGSSSDAWLNFIRVNDTADPAAVERSFKFFKVAFHPDRFSSESLKVEATRYFQHSINAHNNIKRMGKSVP